MSFFKSPDNRVHDIEPEFAFVLPPGSVPISEAEAAALIEQFVPAPAVPQAVTRFQARAALHQAGLLEQAQSLMADPQTPMLARLAWSDALEFRRQSPMVLSMAAALGLSEQQLDGLFTVAAVIEA